MFFFRKKNDKFSELILQMTGNMLSAAQFLLDHHISSRHELRMCTQTIKDYEEMGNKLIEQLTKELNETFITPIDREDLLQLAVHLEDILNSIDHCSGLLEIYSIVNPTENMRKFISKIHQCTVELSGAAHCFSRNQLRDLMTNSIKIKEIESSANNLLRISCKHLLSNEKDPFKIIQYKEIYEAFERVINNCRIAANTLDSIMIKNA